MTQSVKLLGRLFWDTGNLPSNRLHQSIKYNFKSRYSPSKLRLSFTKCTISVVGFPNQIKTCLKNTTECRHSTAHRRLPFTRIKCRAVLKIMPSLYHDYNPLTKIINSYQIYVQDNHRTTISMFCL